MPVTNSYKDTFERSTMRDSGYLRTTSCGKLLDISKKPLEQGDPHILILAPPQLLDIEGTHRRTGRHFTGGTEKNLP